MRSEKLYSVKARISIVDEIFMIVRAVTLGIIIFMSGTFVYREYSFSRGMLLVSWFTLVVSLVAWRFAVNRAIFYFRRRTDKKRNLVLIGDGEIVERLIKHIKNDPHWDYKVKGVVRVRTEPSGEAAGVPVIGTVDNFVKMLSAGRIDEVILTEWEIPRAVIINIMLECEKRMIDFRLIADILGMLTSQVDMRTIDGIPLLGLKESPLAESHSRVIKRAMDAVFSFAGLLVLSPVFLAMAVLIKMNSPGPVFYLQKRVGEDGKHFTMFKFRTMRMDAEKETGPVWTVENDPRRTAVGSFLRKYNIDELPQLINVFIGDMSLVGPRPERPHFVGKFRESVPRYMARHKIRSGMTGWAQVNGLRGNTSIEERTKYDIYYIENWSLAFDMRILLMSLFAIKNAY
jgi:exopolysaccharide biosynthesis polyprenyl glycosylphosphotransferase